MTARLYAAALREAEEPGHVDRLVKRQARLGLILALQEAELAGRQRRARALHRAYNTLLRAA